MDFDEDEAKILLSGPQHQEGFNKVYEHYKAHVFYRTNKMGASLTTEDRQEVVIDVFKAFYNASLKESYDIDLPLTPFLNKITDNKTVDYLRKFKKIETFSLDDDELQDKMIETMRDASYKAGTYGDIWKFGNTQEIRNSFLEYVKTLPYNQKVVASVMAANFPDYIGPSEILNILQSKQIFLSSNQIKKALETLRKNFKTIMESLNG